MPGLNSWAWQIALADPGDRQVVRLPNTAFDRFKTLISGKQR